MSTYASLVGKDFCPDKRGWLWFTFGNFSVEEAVTTTRDTILRVGDVISIGTAGSLMVITSIHTLGLSELVGIYLVSPWRERGVAFPMNVESVIHLRGRRIAR